MLNTVQFLRGKSHGAFEQSAFFLAGNRMTAVAYEKKVLEKKRLASLAKRFSSVRLI